MADTGGSLKDTTAGSKVSNSISRKRKAEQISEDTDKNADALHLPAPVWGHVLDFMPYTEVRSALLVGKHIAVEAARYTKALNIMKESEMYIPAARRFANAEEVNILCLLQGNGTFGFFAEKHTISPGVVNRTIPFLLSFSKLQRSFLGGFLEGSDAGNARSREGYYAPDCVGPENHEDIFRSLVNLFIGASKTGALPEHLMLGDFFRCLNCSHSASGRGHKTSECEFCRDILKYFPLPTLVRNLSATGRGPFCLSKHAIWALVLQRPGVDKEMKEASKYVFCDALVSALDIWDYPRNSKRYTAVEHLKQKWGIKEATDVFVWDISSFWEINAFVNLGFDPSRISRDFLLDRLSDFIGWSEEEGTPYFNFWTKSAVEGVTELGFPIDCKSVPVIDDESL